ncbi:MAG: hypothetical protein H0X26_04155 [Alphaproteobacteria bacterium]|nr:hypothetical protein [Alphaproteobacteria bacterium]
MDNNILLRPDQISNPENEENTCCSMAHPTSAGEKPYDNNDRRKSFLSFKILEEKWKNYKPLIIIFIFCIVLSWVQNNLETHPFETMMHSFMGYFFIFLSLFKFFDLKGFVDGFSTYDLIAKRVRVYGYAYPFIEFFLGIAYLAKIDPFLINWVTLVVMTVSGIGVLKSVLSGQKIKCACLGTVLNVPLGTISIFENFGMGAMAAYSLYN